MVLHFIRAVRRNQIFEKDEMTGIPAFIQACVYLDPKGFPFLWDLKTAFFQFLVASGEDVSVFKNLLDRRIGELISLSLDQVFGRRFEGVRYSRRDTKIRGVWFERHCLH